MQGGGGGKQTFLPSGFPLNKADYFKSRKLILLLTNFQTFSFQGKSQLTGETNLLCVVSPANWDLHSCLPCLCVCEP